MKKDTRDRLLLPILMPIGILLIILLLAGGLSKVLLLLTEQAATVAAFFVASLVMVAGSLLAKYKRVGVPQLLTMIAAVAGAALFAGGIAVALVGGPVEEGHEKSPEPGAPVTIVAKDIAFTETDIAVPSGEPLSIEFDNEDAGTQHNVVVFPSPDKPEGTPLLEGEIITGVAKTAYPLDSLEDGTYYFHCEVHPNMQGALKAGAAPDGGKPSGEVKPPKRESESPAAGSDSPAPAAAATTLDLAAPPNSMTSGFDKTELSAPADSVITIDFANDDPSVPHNVEVFASDPATDSSAELLFSPPDNATIVGPATATYDVGALDAGEYFYHCFVHPTTMTGKLTVT